MYYIGDMLCDVAISYTSCLLTCEEDDDDSNGDDDKKLTRCTHTHAHTRTNSHTLTPMFCLSMKFQLNKKLDRSVTDFSCQTESDNCDKCHNYNWLLTIFFLLRLRFFL